jgi:hypothetical protein
VARRHILVIHHQLDCLLETRIAVDELDLPEEL